MKHILFLLLFLPVLAYAQFPANPNKIRLGNQTTADGLVVRTAAAPSWTPSSINNAWLAFDTVAAVFYYYDTGTWNIFSSGGGIDSTQANNGLAMSGDTVQLGNTLTKNTEVDINGKTLRFRDAAGYPDLFMNGTYGLISSDINTYLDVGSTSGRARIVASTTAQITSAANTDVSATDTVTIVGQRIRLNAADTRIQQVPNDNALNRLVALDSLTGRLYYVDKSSISSGGGVTGTGTTNTLAKWTSSTALGNSLFTDDGTSSVAGGTASFRLPNGTDAQRPGTPTSGMMRYSTTNGVMEWYGASAWERPVESASATGLGTAGRVFYADANGRAAAGDVLYWDATNKRFGANVSPTATFHARGTGATFATTAFIVENSTPTKLLEIRDHGVTKFNDAPTNQAVNFNSTGIFRMVWGSTLNTDANRSRWVIESGDGYLTRFGAANDAGSGSFDWGLVFNRGTGSTISQIRIQKPLRVNEQSEFAGSGALVVHGSGATSSTWTAQFQNSATNNNALMIRDDGRVAIRNAAPSQALHVTGKIQADTLTDTGASIAGFTGTTDAGVLTRLALGSGLSLTSGTLSADNLYTANGTLSGARTVTLGSNTLTFTGTSGAPSGVNFSMTPSTNTIALQSLDGSLNNSAISIAPTRTQIVTTNVTGGTAATFAVFADSLTATRTAIPLNDTLSTIMALTQSGRFARVTKSSLAGLADPGSNGMLARTSANTTTARTLTAGSGIAITNGDGVSGNPTISQSYSLTQITISGGSTFFGTTPERPDNDTPGSTTTSAVGSDFGVSGSTLDYTGASGALLRVEGSVSFSVADDGDYYLSIFKEGTEIAATSTRVTCVAGNYYTIGLPATTTSGTTNDTFDVRIATVTGNSTTTMHRYGFIIERVY